MVAGGCERPAGQLLRYIGIFERIILSQAAIGASFFGRRSASLPPISSVADKTECLMKNDLGREIGNLGSTEAQAQQHLPRMLAEVRRPPLGSHHTIFSIGGDR